MHLYYKYAFEHSPEAIDVCNVDGLIIDMNRTSELLWGIKKQDFINKSNFFNLARVKENSHLIESIKKAIELNEPQEINCYLTYNNIGESKWVSTIIYPITDNDNKVEYFIVVNDNLTKKIKRINENEQLRLYGEMSREILQVLNSNETFDDTLKHILDILKLFTNINSIGIRYLDQNNNYPFYVQNGFTEEFIKNDLITHINLKNCICNNEGIKKYDFLTSIGSFWTSNIDETLKELSQDENLTCLYNKTCIYANQYRSVAIIRIYNKDKIIGFIHFTDKQKDYFNINIIEILESISANIGISLVRKKAEEDLKRLIVIQDVLYKELVYKNSIFETLASISKILLDCSDPENVNQVLQIIGESLNTSRSFLYEITPLNNINNDYSLSYKYEWCNINIPSSLKLKNTTLQELNLKKYEEVVLENKILNISDTSLLSIDEQMVFNKQNVKSLLLTPVYLPNTNLYGFIGFDQCDNTREWKDCEINILKNISNLLGSFIKKCYNERKLNNFLYDQSLILNNLDSYVWFFRDINTYGFINDKYYNEFILQRNDSGNDQKFKDDCLLVDCHILDEAKEHVETNKIVLETKKLLKYEQWITNNLKQKRLLSIKKIPVIDEAFINIVCIANDITDKYLHEKDLLESFKNIFEENNIIINENISQIKQTVIESSDILKGIVIH